MRGAKGQRVYQHQETWVIQEEDGRHMIPGLGSKAARRLGEEMPHGGLYRWRLRQQQ